MKIVIGNQKNYMTIQEVNNFLNNIKLTDNTILCPSNIYLPYYLNNDYKIGLQNISDNKTITGEISINQAKSLNIDYVIVGHSERRLYMGETNKIINEKIKKLSEFNIVLCVGENENETNKEEFLKNEILECLDNVKISNIMIAYEPIWAIGTGITPTNEEIEKTALFIKKIIKDNYNENIKVLYGGSVKSSNINSLNAINSIDGFLVGKSSTNPIEFNEIVKVVG